MPNNKNIHIICKTQAIRNRSSFSYKGKVIHISMYELGLKYCTHCDEWFSQLELKCLCCNKKLRQHARINSNRKDISKMEWFDYLHNLAPLLPKYSLSDLDFKKAQQLIKLNYQDNRDVVNQHLRDKRKIYEDTLEFKIINFFYSVRLMETQVRTRRYQIMMHRRRRNITNFMKSI